MAKKEKKIELKKEKAISTDVKQIKTKQKKESTPKIKTEKKNIGKHKTTPKETTTPKKQDPLEALSKFICSIKEKHMPDILHDLMTEKEIKDFAERIEILRQLEKGVTQRVIAKNLGISVTTVSRGSKVLQTGKEKIKKYL